MLCTAPTVNPAADASACARVRASVTSCGRMLRRAASTADWLALRTALDLYTDDVRGVAVRSVSRRLAYSLNADDATVKVSW